MASIVVIPNAVDKAIPVPEARLVLMSPVKLFVIILDALIVDIFARGVLMLLVVVAPLSLDGPFISRSCPTMSLTATDSHIKYVPTCPTIPLVKEILLAKIV